MTKYLITLLSLGSLSFASGDSLVLTESYFKNLDINKTPQLQQIELGYLNQKSSKQFLDDQYNYYLTGGASYGESKEQALAIQIPVNSTLRGAQIGVQKKSPYGFSVGTSYFTEGFTNNFVTDGTTNGFRFDIEIDLFKDFLGRTSKSDFDAAKAGSDEALITKEIQKKQFVNELRKAYWDLVATEEAYKVSKTLQNSAAKQLKEQRRKYKSGIGSRGDVARFESLVSNRSTSLTELKARRTQKIQQLKQQLPELVGKDIKIANYNLRKTVDEFFQCTAVVENEKQTPLNFTRYDEILALQSRRLGLKLKSASNYAGPDIKLATQYDILGNDFSFGDAQSELTGDNRARYTVSLQFSMPLGSSNRKTEELQIKMNKAQIGAQMLQVDARMHSVHSGFVDSLGLLKKVILTKYQNQKQMALVLADSKKKYRQARISSKNLIDDEDQSLNNDLSLIQVQAEIIMVMLDYFSVFTETPCSLNQIK